MILRPGIDADDLQKLIKEDFEKDSQDKPEPKVIYDEDGNKIEEKVEQIEGPPKTYDYLD